MSGPKLKSLDSKRELCQIIREPSYEKALSEIAKSIQRMDQVDSAIDWALARGPEFFDNEEEDFYLWVTDDIPNFPPLRVLYKFEKDYKIVRLLSIELKESII